MPIYTGMKGNLDVIDWKGIVDSRLQAQQVANQRMAQVENRNIAQQAAADKRDALQQTIAIDVMKEGNRKAEFEKTFMDQHALLGQQIETSKQQQALVALQSKKAELEIATGAIEADGASKVAEANRVTMESENIVKATDYMSKNAVPQRNYHNQALAFAAGGDIMGALDASQSYARGYTGEFSIMNAHAAKTPLGLLTPEMLSAKMDAAFGEIKTQLIDTSSSKTVFDKNDTEANGTPKQSFSKTDANFRKIKLSDIPKLLQGGTLEEKQEAVRIMAGYASNPSTKDNALRLIHNLVPNASDLSEIRLDRIDPSLDVPRASLFKQYDEAVKTNKPLATIKTDPKTGLPVQVMLPPKVWLKDLSESESESPKTREKAKSLMDVIPAKVDISTPNAVVKLAESQNTPKELAKKAYDAQVMQMTTDDKVRREALGTIDLDKLDDNQVRQLALDLGNTFWGDANRLSESARARKIKDHPISEIRSNILGIQKENDMLYPLRALAKKISSIQ